jgi:DNA primase
MSLPPGFLEELRTRISLSQVVGRKVTWDLRKSNQGRGDMWAPCPFHQERTASFHVDDRKGFYYCFGCHAKGDAVSFLKETENLSFLEAVEWLAREAGMPMPARDPQAAQKADRRAQLSEVVEEAIRHYRLQLRLIAAQPARDYLARRGLSPEGQDRFGIGYAPVSRTGLCETLVQKGFAPELIVDAGLCARPEDGGSPYDRFRDRIIFPIRDARGRAISLGGRAMDPNARAKYLNGPETEIFDKGRSLYNIGPAREASVKGRPLIVAEGYMDVIALSEAGFPASVAPLGTAVTEDQLRLIWWLHPEPLVALDGDKAGIAAALRLVDLALPLLEAGRGLRFAVMPPGSDPDDLIRAQGAPAMQQVLDAARPMVDLLWQRETEGRVFDSPERRAALDRTLAQILARIRDPVIHGHYAAELRRLTWDLTRNGASRRPAAGRRSPRPPAPPAAPVAATRSSILARAGASPVEEHLLEAVMLATLVAHPGLIRRFESGLETVDLTAPGHDRLRHLLLRHADAGDPEALRQEIAKTDGALLDMLFAQRHVAAAPPARIAADPELALMCVAEALAKLDARRGARREIEDAAEDLTGLADEGVTWRLSRAAEALRGSTQTRIDRAATADEDRDALSRQLQDMIDAEIWVKKKR